MSSVLVGTSGYSYLDWVGSVYPEGTLPEEFLSRYAALFRTVELNVSFYRMPSVGQARRLLSQAGPSLHFSVKANEALTHRLDASSWKETARAFRAALDPFRAADRLAAVLFQFPQSFDYGIGARRYLDALLAELAGLPLAVEFRCPDWYNNRVIDAFRARHAALVSIDTPDLSGLPPTMDVVTAPLAYVRLHGRNAADWWGSDSASRYDYSYADSELDAWADRIKGIASQAERVLVYFNNPQRGQAVANARTLSLMLSRLGLVP